MWFTQCGLCPPEKLPDPSFLLSTKIKGYNLQHTRCNFLFFLSQYPLSKYNIRHNTQSKYNYLIREGFLLEKKNPKIISTVRSVTL
jgi:hypothetical protein